jgi:hypothetical protein
MNPVIKIINQVLILINKLIDGLNKRTVETIRNSFFFIVAMLALVGIYIGYSKGKNSAKIYGKPLTESTNNIFDITIKRNRDTAQFSSMLESELMEESKEMQLKKIEFPAKEKLTSEFTDKIAEPEPANSESSALPPGSDKIAEIKKTDEKYKTPYVHELKKETPESKSEGKDKEQNKPIETELKIIEK